MLCFSLLETKGTDGTGAVPVGLCIKLAYAATSSGAKLCVDSAGERVGGGDSVLSRPRPRKPAPPLALGCTMKLSVAVNAGFEDAATRPIESEGLLASCLPVETRAAAGLVSRSDASVSQAFRCFGCIAADVLGIRTVLPGCTISRTDSRCSNASGDLYCLLVPATLRPAAGCSLTAPIREIVAG